MSDFPIAEEHQHPGKPGPFRRGDSIVDPLHVITVVFNAERYRSRWALYAKFADYIEHAGGILWTVEAAFGNRAFAVTDATNPRHIQVRMESSIFTKENLGNIGVSRLPRNWRYCALVDCDVHWVRPDIIGETLHQLQHFDVVQMWADAYDVSSRHDLMQRHLSFGHCYVENIPEQNPRQAPSYYYAPPKQAGAAFYWHPGWATAWRRSAYEAVGGWIDWGLCGAGDNHMMWALIGRGRDSVHPKVHPNYIDMVMEWEKKAEMLQRNIGYVPGTLLHEYHGSKEKRRYYDRWRILTDLQFDPARDIKRGWDGVLRLEVRDRRTQMLRDRVREYFRGRDEDSLS